MTKVKIDSGEEYFEAMLKFTSEFMANNPIFTHLSLTDEQMDILMKMEIMPKFKDVYDVTFRAQKQLKLAETA